MYSRQIPNLPDGTFDLKKLEDILPDPTDPHCTHPRVVCIENTHNWCGGRVLPTQFIDDLHELCVKYDLKMHLDGARLMNASVASNQSVSSICKHCDSISFCFSKGLGTPVGSVLVGSHAFIQR